MEVDAALQHEILEQTANVVSADGGDMRNPVFEVAMQRLSDVVLPPPSLTVKERVEWTRPRRGQGGGHLTECHDVVTTHVCGAKLDPVHRTPCFRHGCATRGDRVQSRSTIAWLGTIQDLPTASTASSARYSAALLGEMPPVGMNRTSGKTAAGLEGVDALIARQGTARRRGRAGESHDPAVATPGIAAIDRCAATARLGHRVLGTRGSRHQRLWQLRPRRRIGLTPLDDATTVERCCSLDGGKSFLGAQRYLDGCEAAGHQRDQWLGVHWRCTVNRNDTDPAMWSMTSTGVGRVGMRSGRTGAIRQPGLCPVFHAVDDWMLFRELLVDVDAEPGFVVGVDVGSEPREAPETSLCRVRWLVPLLNPEGRRPEVKVQIRSVTTGEVSAGPCHAVQAVGVGHVGGLSGWGDAAHLAHVHAQKSTSRCSVTVRHSDGCSCPVRPLRVGWWCEPGLVRTRRCLQGRGGLREEQPDRFDVFRECHCVDWRKSLVNIVVVQSRGRLRIGRAPSL